MCMGVVGDILNFRRAERCVGIEGICLAFRYRTGWHRFPSKRGGDCSVVFEKRTRKRGGLRNRLFH